MARRVLNEDDAGVGAEGEGASVVESVERGWFGRCGGGKGVGVVAAVSVPIGIEDGCPGSGAREADGVVGESGVAEIH